MALWMLSSAAFAMAYMIIGKKIRAMAEVGSVASLGDISDLRFNKHKGIKALLSIIIFIGAIAYLASQISAVSALFGHLLGWDPMLAGFVIFGILTAYTALSGEARRHIDPGLPRLCHGCGRRSDDYYFLQHDRRLQ